MGRNMTKNDNDRGTGGERRYLRPGMFFALLAVGVAAIVGLSVFNAGVKPNRDMQWYIRKGVVEVAAPPAASSGFDTLEGRTDAARTLPEATATQALTAPPTHAPTDTPGPTEAPAPVTLTITAVGDCTFGGDTNDGGKGYANFKSYVDQFGYEYFFHNVRDLFQSDDLTIINLEGPLTIANTKSSNHGYMFRGDPEWVPIMTGSGVDLCNLANNHSQDYGEAGFQETCQVLEHNGIGWSGYSQVYCTEIKGVRVASLGFTKWDHTADDIAEAVSEARKNCDLLIVSMHWGKEKVYETSAQQSEMAHAAIDAGADVVLGTHPHVIGGMERYKGKTIVYSLGNFCFGGNPNVADHRCLIFQQTFSFDPQTGVSDAGINLIPASVSYATDRNDFQPRVLPVSEGLDLLRTVAKYSINFSSGDILWMPTSYMVENGLTTVKTPEESAAEAPDEGAAA